jgi:tetratricopeptide (TPR) repeat protein
VPPDDAAVIEFLDGFETRYPDARALSPRARELRLRARVALGQTAEAKADLDAYLAAGGTDAERRHMLSALGRDLTSQAERGGPEGGRAAAEMARSVYAALVREGGDAADRIALADLELRGGDAAAARRTYEEVLAGNADSAEALRGAARAAAEAGDRDAALGYWRRVVEASATGGTSWYEARLAQVALLAGNGNRSQACDLIRSSRGRATSTGADTLEARLRAMEPEVCK